MPSTSKQTVRLSPGRNLASARAGRSRRWVRRTLFRDSPSAWAGAARLDRRARGSSMAQILGGQDVAADAGVGISLTAARPGNKGLPAAEGDFAACAAASRRAGAL